MITRGLLIRLDARPEMGDDVEKFLVAGASLVRAESGTMAWFAVKFGRLDYGIVGAFVDEVDRDAHLKGKLAKALQARTGELFERPPEIEAVEVISSKLPVTPPLDPIRKGLVLRLQPKSGHAREMEEFIREGRVRVQEEKGTIAWLGLRLADGTFGVVDFFPDNAARLAHLAGQVPLELARHALPQVGGPADLEMLDVIAERIVVPVPV